MNKLVVLAAGTAAIFALSACRDAVDQTDTDQEEVEVNLPETPIESATDAAGNPVPLPDAGITAAPSQDDQPLPTE